jgi:prepilin-type N-terminal cleavage/methylation domain-containing protein
LRAATVKSLALHPASRPRRAASGLTLIELIVVMSIIGLCAALLLDRLRYYQEAAEKAVMEQTVGALKSAVTLRAASLLLKGRERDIGSLAHANPIEWLMEPPSGYRGEFRAPDPPVPPGSWYFDATRSELVYVPNLDAHLKPNPDGSKRLRFRVQIEFEPVAPDSTRERGSLAATRLAPVVPYAWF